MEKERLKLEQIKLNFKEKDIIEQILKFKDDKLKFEQQKSKFNEELLNKNEYNDILDKFLFDVEKKKLFWNDENYFKII